MSRRCTVAWVGLLLATGSLLSACGGGGGGGGGGGDAYSISTNSLTFTAMQGGGAPPPQVVNVSVNSGTVYVLTTQSGNGFSYQFQITGATSGVITITPDFPGVAGTFTGAISVRGCSTVNCTGSDVAGSPKTISVTYTISAAPTLSSNPGAIDFVTATGLTPAAKTVNLSLSTGASSWSSVITYPSAPPFWLLVTPPSAPALSQTASVSVNMAGLVAGTYTATITFSAGTVFKVVPVTLTVKDPSVSFVSPYVATTSVGGDVVIRGFGFSNLAAGTLQVQFGGTAATNVSRVSDTEIHATYPGLTAGNKAVTVGDGTITIPIRVGVKLAVVDPPAFAYSAITRTNSPKFAVNLTYDDERKAIYLMDPDNLRIEAYRFTGASWVADLPLSVNFGTGNPRIALSPDGAELLNTFGTNMRRLNPATLGLIGTVVDALPLIGTGGGNLNLLAFANDGNAIGNAYAPATGVSLYRYDMLTQQFAALSSQSDLTNRTIVASGNGATLFLPTFESLIPSFAKPIFTYSASSGNLAQSAVTTTGTGHASVDRIGSKVILTSAESSANQVTRVYNGSLAVLGDLPDSVPPDLRGFVISPDGAFAYAYYSGAGKVRKTIEKIVPVLEHEHREALRRHQCRLDRREPAERLPGQP